MRIRKSVYNQRFGELINNPPLEEKNETSEIQWCIKLNLYCQGDEDQITSEKSNCCISWNNSGTHAILPMQCCGERTGCMHVLFNALVKNEAYESPSKFFMHNCQCSKHANGYWSLRCVAEDCEKSKRDGKQKVSKKTERVNHTEPFKTV